MAWSCPASETLSRLTAKLDIDSRPRMNGGTMETLKPFMLGFAVFWPPVLCIVLTWRVVFHRPTDWKLACCVAGLSVATSLLLLLASEKLLFLRWQEAVVQVNQKAEEVRKLTEQNKIIAKATAQCFKHIAAATFTTAGESVDMKYLENFLKEAGLSPTEIDETLGRSPPAHKP